MHSMINTSEQMLQAHLYEVIVIFPKDLNNYIITGKELISVSSGISTNSV